MTGWRKSSYCDIGSSCVWVDMTDDSVYVTSSGRHHTLAFTHDEWRAFLAGVRNGEFDLPAVTE